MTARQGGAVDRSGLALWLSGGAIVTALFLRLPGGCQRAVDENDPLSFRRRYSPGELSTTIADILHMDAMAAFTRQQLTDLLRGISLRQIRLASGLVLFAYLVSHFLNHALGN